MGRIKNGEPKPGMVRECTTCKKEIYKSPSQLIYKKVFCSKECRKKDSFNFPCLVCSSPVHTQPAQLKYRARSTCSPFCRRVLARKRANERRIGYTKHQIDRLARYSIETGVWRNLVFKRDDYTCQICGVRGTYLEADHIKPWAFFSELRYEISNGRTLCKICHHKTKISYKKMRELYGNN